MFCLLKIINGEIPPPFITFKVSYIIAKNHNKSGTTLLSQSLIPLNKVFDK